MVSASRFLGSMSRKGYTCLLGAPRSTILGSYFARLYQGLGQAGRDFLVVPLTHSGSHLPAEDYADPFGPDDGENYTGPANREKRPNAHY